MANVSVINIPQGRVSPRNQAPALLPPGETVLEYQEHDLGSQFGRGVLTVWFKAVDYGDVAIPCYYNVRREGKGGFVPAGRSKLVNDFRTIFTERITRLDQFPLDWLKDTQILGELRTVTLNHSGETIEEGACYSVVDRLLKVYA